MEITERVQYKVAVVICCITACVVLVINVLFMTFDKTIVNKIINQQFNTDTFNDEIALIITSCGRFDELEITIVSFEKYNTYKHIITKLVIDDCNDDIGLHAISLKFPNYRFVHTTTPRTNIYSNSEYRILLSIKEAIFKHIINNPKYTNVEYVMMCEDDWKFYKRGFIEDSLAILKSNYNQKYLHKPISMFFLRNLQYFEPYLGAYSFCGGFDVSRIEGSDMSNIYETNLFGYGKNKIKYYVHDDIVKGCWGRFATGPGLKRIEHFTLLWNKLTLNHTTTQCKGEYCMNCVYKDYNLTMAITTDNGYVGHMGHKQRHVRQRMDGRNLIGIDDIKNMTVINNNIAIDNNNCMYIHLQV